MPQLNHIQLKSLKDFYALMADTRQLRFEIVGTVLRGEPVRSDIIQSLQNALDSLEDVPEMNGKRILSLDGTRSIDLDMDYEINELRKDIFYLEEGEETFLELLADLHPGFDEYVEAGRELLAGLDFNCLITDRDGTINNYCSRYLTSIQSIYNAVFLTRFAKRRVQHPVILTSAPLDGLVEISVNPHGRFYYAASKGRECRDLVGRTRRLPIPREKQLALEALNTCLNELIQQSEYEKFSLIGSGLQFKFGQTTVARQDIGGSIPEAGSRAFLKTVEDIVAGLDPDAQNFRIEDTGLDVEIILTVETDGDGLKDFDKGDGVKFLDTELELEMFHGPHLVCGDTASDVPMLEEALKMAPDTRAIFVTTKDDLATRINGLTRNALIVPEPDMLVAIMGTVST